MGMEEPSLTIHIANILSLLQHENEEEEVRQRSVYFTQILSPATAGKEPSSSPNSQSALDQSSPEKEPQPILWTGEELAELDDEHLEQLLAQTDELISDGTYDLQQVDLFRPREKTAVKKDAKMTRAQKIQKKVGLEVGNQGGKD